MREHEIEAYLTAQVAKVGGETRKVQWIGRRGAPDRLVMLPEVRKTVRHDGPQGTQYTNKITRQATVFWVELKQPGEKPRPNQVREHERLMAFGMRVVVIDSLEGVDELLKGL